MFTGFNQLKITLGDYLVGGSTYAAMSEPMMTAMLVAGKKILTSPFVKSKVARMLDVLNPRSIAPLVRMIEDSSITKSGLAAIKKIMDSAGADVVKHSLKGGRRTTMLKENETKKKESATSTEVSKTFLSLK